MWLSYFAKLRVTLSHGDPDAEWIKIDILKAASYNKARLITGAIATEIENEHKLESENEDVTLK